MNEFLEYVSNTLSSRDGNLNDPRPLFKALYAGFEVIASTPARGWMKVVAFMIWLKIVRMLFRKSINIDDIGDIGGYGGLAFIMAKLDEKDEKNAKSAP